MRAPTAFEVVLGIGLSGGAVYMLISYTQGKHKVKEQKSVNSKKRHTGTQAEHDQHRQDQVEAIERQFFKGISHKLTLTEGQINQLKTLLKSSDSENKDPFENCQNLQDILMSMKAVRLITVGRYRLITAILTEAGIDAIPITWHIEQLSKAIEDVTKGEEPKGFEADPFEYDAVIIYCEENRDMVIDFINYAKVNLDIQDLSLILFENFNISQPNLQSIVNVLLCARYVYVFVTPELTEDRFARYMAGIALTDSLRNNEKSWRIIPIWTTKGIVSIPEFEGIDGLKYWQFFDKSSRKAFLRVFEHHILDGRKTISQVKKV